MTEQFLDRPQVRAGAQEMRGEGVAERMGRGRGREPQRGARLLQAKLDDARGQPLAPHADEERIVRAELGGAEIEIALDRGARDREDRDETCLVALAGHTKCVAALDRRIGDLERQRLGNTQARTVEQRQHGGIAGERPFRRVRRGDVRPLHESSRFRLGKRLRHRVGQFRHGHRADRVVLAVAAPLQEPEEHAQRTQGAGQAAAPHILAAAKSKERAHVASR